MAYVLGVVGELISKTGVKMKVSLDGGEPVDKELLLATFSNGRYYGGGFNAAPKARLCDGLMDVCFVTNDSLNSVWQNKLDKISRKSSEC